MDRSLFKSFSRGLSISLLGILAVLVFAGCQEDLVSDPSITKATTGGSVTTLSIPQNVTATQGGYRKVTVTWTGCNAASQYKVYSAESTSDTFVQCGETKGNVTTCSIDEPAGTTKFYRVTAVKYDGTETSLSNWSRGTTIATPVITSVTADDSSNSATVVWWMENCNKKTYISSVKYLIEGKKGTSTTASLSATVDGSHDSYTFENLEGKSEYSFTVSAYIDNGDAKPKTETSTSASVTTAHRIIPMPPVNLTATQGMSKDSITVTWNMPEKTDVAKDDGTYESTENFFVVYRKLSSASDSAYSIVKIYATDNSSRKIDGEMKTPDEIFSEYKPYISGVNDNITLTYTDTPESGKNYGVKYDYKVKVYVDSADIKASADNSKPVNAKSSSVSESSVTGWLISKPTLNMKADYEKNQDSTKFISSTVSFTPAFDTLSLNNAYSFVLTESRTDLATDKTVQEGWPKVISHSNNVLTCCNAKTFSDMTVTGYYRYTLYVIPRIQNESDYDNYLSTQIISAPADGKITITDDTSAVPGLESVTIRDGYKDCFKLTWKYDKDCKYILDWTTGTGTKGSYTLTETDVASAADGEDFTFTHKGGTKTDTDPAIVSGEKRTYTVTADKGITKTVTAKVSDSVTEAETLGTAVPEMYDNNYKTITVRWPKVQKADAYELTATMKKSGTAWSYTKSDETTVESDGVTYIEYVLTDSGNYKDAALSGLEISFKVTAKNNTSADTTDASTEICTLGPAKTEPSVNGINKEFITYQWKKSRGAKGYLVHRGIKLYDGSIWQDSTNCISYYISADCSTIEAGGESVSTDCAELTYDSSTETYTLKDKYHESTSDTPGAYDFSQAAIAWGVPFTYYVVPVKNSVNDMTIDTTSDVHKIGIKNDFNYANLTECTGSTYGYGQNVMASKCDSDTEITLTWGKPQKVIYAPNIYFRKAGSTANSWTRIMKATPAAEDTSITLNFEDCFSTLTSFDYDANSKYKAYEFAVAYFATLSENYIIPDSFVNNSANSGLASIELTGNNQRYEYTTGHSPEKKNKGYLLTIKPLSAQYAGTETANLYKEMINWTDWDFTERGIGPSSYSLYIKNKNLINADDKDEYGTTGWVKLLSLGEDCRANNYDTEKTAALANDLTFDILNNQLTISATSLTNGSAATTDGLLKVLRDARHYYELVAKTSNTHTASGHDESVYAYRQITDVELGKCLSLIVADAIYQSGISSGGDRNCDDADGNSFTITHSSATKTVTWGTSGNSYRHQFVSGTPYDTSTTLTSDWVISIDNASSRAAIDGSSLYYLPSATIKVVSHNSGLSSYKQNVSLTVGAAGSQGLFAQFDSVTTSWILTLKKGSTTIHEITSSNDDEFLRWFPLKLNTSRDSKVTAYNAELPIFSTEYGWWPTK